MRICVYAIAKNEAHFVPRFCESAKGADLILIADTGSTDGLPDVARQHGAVVHDISIFPWRFDLARNAALALVPRDFDVCISLDIDEVLQPGWREEIERVWEAGKTTRLRYLYDWGNDLKFYYDKIHSRNGYLWKYACHEYLFADPRVEEVTAVTPILMVEHKPDPAKSRSSYLSLLSVSAQEDKNCARSAFYYARELWFNYRHEDALSEFARYLTIAGGQTDHERSYAHRVMGLCHATLNRIDAAEKSFLSATLEAPYMREPWCELAMLTYKQHDWAKCLAFATKALAISDRPFVYTSDAAAWGSQPYDLASIAAWNLGLRDLAVRYVKEAIDLAPFDTRLQNNLALMTAGEAKEVS